jgi:hypothetical protein
MNLHNTTDGAEVLAALRASGIPMETLDACATLLHEWACGDEPDARILVVKIAEVLRDAS